CANTPSTHSLPTSPRFTVPRPNGKRVHIASSITPRNRWIENARSGFCIRSSTRFIRPPNKRRLGAARAAAMDKHSRVASLLLDALDESRHRFDSFLHLGIAFGRELLARLLKGCPPKRHLESRMRRYILAAVDRVHDLIEGKFSAIFLCHLSEVVRRRVHRNGQTRGAVTLTAKPMALSAVILVILYSGLRRGGPGRSREHQDQQQERGRRPRRCGEYSA